MLWRSLVLLALLSFALMLPGRSAQAIEVPIEAVDFDGDQRISILDLTMQASVFTQPHDTYDVDKDGRVSILDLTLTASWFSRSYSVSFVQKPLVTSGFSGVVTSMVVAPDGRIFVAEKSGRLRVVKGGALLSTPFLSVPVSTSGERGLIGVTLDPDFDSNGYVYVHYTTSSSPHGRVSRFTAQGDVAVAGSERILIELDPASSSGNHNGGELAFGLDDKLYVATGDATNGANAPSLGSTHGKILRINADGSIPTDNPFYTQTTGTKRAIWAKGFRNPFTGAVDPFNGRHYVNDVGEVTWEEVNLLVRGADYGWPSCEGSCSVSGKTNPIYQYGRDVGRAITGAAFYRGGKYPVAFAGDYFFGDYTADFIRRLDGTASHFLTGDAPVDLAVDAQGNLYWLGLFGTLTRVDAVVTVN